MAMQLPYTSIPLVLADDDVPVGDAIAVFFFQLGGVICISLGQTLTISIIVELVPRYLPDIYLQTVIDAGAAGLTSLELSSEALQILQEIWNTAIVKTMVLSTAVVAAAVPFTFAMEWLNANRV